MHKLFHIVMYQKRGFGGNVASSPFLGPHAGSVCLTVRLCLQEPSLQELKILSHCGLVPMASGRSLPPNR